MKLKKSGLFLLLALPAFSGCVILENLDEVFTLKEYSDNKDQQHRFVKETNDHYDALVKVIAQGHINDYKDETAFKHAFGGPILKKDLKDGTERWLYRYAIYRFSKDKVYLYFDRDGQLVKWERLPCQKFF